MIQYDTFILIEVIYVLGWIIWQQRQSLNLWLIVLYPISLSLERIISLHEKHEFNRHLYVPMAGQETKARNILICEK